MEVAGNSANEYPPEAIARDQPMSAAFSAARAIKTLQPTYWRLDEHF
jgi:hypothetical protein